jgi:hypothetical protein
VLPGCKKHIDKPNITNTASNRDKQLLCHYIGRGRGIVLKYFACWAGFSSLRLEGTTKCISQARHTLHVYAAWLYTRVWMP